MSITTQQQLALARGLFYSVETNQLIPFNPVEANSSVVLNAPLPLNESITVPIDSEGATESLVSIFTLVDPTTTVNLSEGDKTITDVATLNSVGHTLGSRFIFARDVLSVETLPQVGNTVVEDDSVSNDIYRANTIIEEINPEIKLKIQDISSTVYFRDADVSFGGTGKSAITVRITAVPITPGFKMPFFKSQWRGHKFALNKRPGFDSVLAALDTNTELKTTLCRGIWGPSATLNEHPTCSFTNLLNDLFIDGDSVTIVNTGTVGIVNPLINNGKIVLQQTSIDPVSGVVNFEFYLDVASSSLFDGGNDPAPIIEDTSVPRTITLDLVLMGTTSFGQHLNLFEIPGSSDENDASYLEYVPNTGSGEVTGLPAENTLGSLDLSIFCYKLDKTTISSITGVSSAFTKTNILDITGTTVESLASVYGGSINKDSLLDAWEIGYQKAGMILQNKLKK
jgi:hypothetical protein